MGVCKEAFFIPHPLPKNQITFHQIYHLYTHVLFWCFLLAGLRDPANGAWNDPYSFPVTRDPLKWPFSQNSIWNMPLGSNARYIPANIPVPSVPTDWATQIDDEIIILTPDSPLVKVYYNNAGWTGADRCQSATDTLLMQLPIPNAFSTKDSHIGQTPNMQCAVLLPDHRTLSSSQPFDRCGPGGIAVTQYWSGNWNFPNVDIYGPGIEGAHGGCGLSSFGGDIRLGELVKGAPPIHHALKVDLHLMQPTPCTYRWPAKWCDGPPADTNKGKYKEGALLALLPSFGIATAGFKTEPAKYIARAIQDYGAYVVDNSGYDAYVISTEWSPDGRVRDEFMKNWGFDMNGQTIGSNWGQDMKLIFQNAYVVDNNGPSSIGGGGTPRAPLAPPFAATSASFPLPQRPGGNGTRIMEKNAVYSVEYDMSISNRVAAALYSFSGRRVRTLSDDVETAGRHTLSWNGRGLSSGTYMLRIRRGNDESECKVVFIK